MNIQLHPTLADAIARAIMQRSLAADGIGTVISRVPYKHGDFLFWRDEHIEATQKLAAFGIRLPTYVGDARVEGLR